MNAERRKEAEVNDSNRPPEHSAEKRLANLGKALAARRRRLEVKEGLRSGELSVADVVAMASDPAVGRLAVRDLIRSLPHYGEKKAERIMRELGISESRRVKGLGRVQAENLIRVLDGKRSG